MTNLFWPLINASLFFGALFIVIRKKLSLHCQEESQRVREHMAFAQEKEQKARTKLMATQKLWEDSQALIQQMAKDNQLAMNSLTERIQEETKKNLQRLEKDASDRIEAYREKKIRAMLGELVEKIILEAKGEIQEDSEKKDRISKKIIERVAKLP